MDVILPICEAARSFAPEYDEEQTAEKFLEKMHRFFKGIFDAGIRF